MISSTNGHSSPERESQEGYEEYRSQQNSEYRRAWESAPKAFKKAVEIRGLKADVQQLDGQSLEFDENRSNTAYIPDMGASLDTHIDYVIEKYGSQHRELIRNIAHDLQEPMRIEIEQSRGLMLGRVACYLVKGGKINVMARIHAILHSIPLLAKQLEFSSLRDSARDCGCSPQWMKKQRDKVCQQFGLPIPVEARKSDEAKKQYQEIGKTRHWRKQTMKTPKNGCKPNGNHAHHN